MARNIDDVSNQFRPTVDWTRKPPSLYVKHKTAGSSFPEDPTAKLQACTNAVQGGATRTAPPRSTADSRIGCANVASAGGEILTVEPPRMLYMNVCTYTIVDP
jgi:hypothetical protein